MFVHVCHTLQKIDNDISTTKNKYDIIMIKYISEVMIFRHRNMMSPLR